MSTKETRKLIIDTAVGLFNERGVTTVTTNHIAAGCSLSPGNLYYHYRNKEQIIREIFIQITEEYHSILDNDMNHIIRLFEMGTQILYRYRFFYRELATLITTDPELKKLYRDNQLQKYSIIEKLILNMTKEGLLNEELVTKGLKALIESSWMHTDFWIPYLSISGEDITPETISRGIRGYFELVLPFFTDRGREQIMGYF
ncbi:MAG TPA: TetR/AcrR family transcriptional regulator [Spirochaetota bacterium]|nr:TetR/AcrR family transcriptional regulator [Spirochaetota bacterium]